MSIISFVTHKSPRGNSEVNRRKIILRATTVPPESQTMRRTTGILRRAERRSPQSLRKFCRASIVFEPSSKGRSVDKKASTQKSVSVVHRIRHPDIGGSGSMRPSFDDESFQ